MDPIRILLVDDHALLREVLTYYLRTQTDIQVVGEAGTAEEGMRAAVATQPNVVLLDVTMPGGGGIGAVPELRRHLPGTRVVILSDHDEPSYLRAAQAAGAAGYMLKSSHLADLLDAVRAVHQGESYVDMPLREHATEPAPAPRSPDAAPIARLSDREREVLLSLAQGLRYQAIAEKMGVSVKTVETYRSRLTAKLGFKNRADLMRFAIESGLLANGIPA
jgi:DNA-binding NarL/FixJ family response regulator